MKASFFFAESSAKQFTGEMHDTLSGRFVFGLDPKRFDDDFLQKSLKTLNC